MPSSKLITGNRREKPSRERQQFHEITLLEIQNSNQESTFPRLNMSIEHRKRTNQKKIVNVVISDFVESNPMNFIEKTLKKHGKELIKLEFRTSLNDCKKRTNQRRVSDKARQI